METYRCYVGDCNNCKHGVLHNELCSQENGCKDCKMREDNFCVCLRYTKNDYCEYFEEYKNETKETKTEETVSSI